MNQSKLDRDLKTMVPGGVHSFERAWGYDLSSPTFKSGRGAYLFDLNGERYIDLIMCWGANLLGHSPEEVTQALIEEIPSGLNLGFPSPQELELIQLLRDAFSDIAPSEELMVRFVNSRLVAVDLALRIARSYTNRNRVIVFEGAFHGGLGSLIAKTTSIDPLLSVPLDSGTHRRLVKDTIVLTFNDPEGFKEAMDKEGENVAAVIIDPLMTDSGIIPLTREMAEVINKYRDSYKFLVVVDEYLSAFRKSWGGAYRELGLKPDIVIVGGTISSGMPIGALIASSNYLEALAPIGKIYQSETLVANRLSILSALKTLEKLRDPSTLESMERKASKVREFLLENSQLPLRVNQWGASISVYFTDSEVKNPASAELANYSAYTQLWEELYSKRILLPPSHLSMWTFSLSLSDEDLNYVLDAIKEALKSLA